VKEFSKKILQALRDHGAPMTVPEIRHRLGTDAPKYLGTLVSRLARLGAITQFGNAVRNRSYRIADQVSSRPASERVPSRRMLPTLQPAATRTGDSRERPARPHADRALTAADAAPADLEFVAAIDHRSRIAVRAGGVGVRIEPADALELFEFLGCQVEVIKAAAKAARGGKR